MFTYCNNNPTNRSDPTGQLWAAIGVGTLASVVASAVSSWLAGEEFTVGDAVGAAVEGFIATSMTLLGVSPILANPVATFCGQVIGKAIDGDTSKEAAQEIGFTTARSFLLTGALNGTEKVFSKFVAGKYAHLDLVGKLIKEATYKAKHVDESSVQTIISRNFWDSLQSVAIELAF